VNVVEWMDQGAQNAVAPLHRPWLDSALIALTHTADAAVMAGLAVLAVVVLLILRRWRTAACVGAAMALAFLLCEVGKDVVNRKRPDVAARPAQYPLPKTPSFPSGHATESMTLYGALALTVGRRLRSRWLRALALLFGLGLPLLIGFSRVYLGVHFFTDVLAGWILGFLLALLAGWADLRWERHPNS
jgi:membrane-associated phospholipid phosphatase